jgi:hypothetical protein
MAFRETASTMRSRAATVAMAGRVGMVGRAEPEQKGARVAPARSERVAACMSAQDRSPS